MEDISASTSVEHDKHRTPWGLFIGLLIILAIIVTGAYYAFTDRVAAQGEVTARVLH